MLQALRLSLRRLLRAPVIFVSALVILSLAFAANAVVLMLAGPSLLSSLPFPRPQELVAVQSVSSQPGESRIATGISYLNLQDARAATRSFTHLAGYALESPALTAAGMEPTAITSAVVSGEFFAVLGAHPLLGRVITEDDNHTNAPRVVVLAYGLWSSRFGADPAAVGSMVQLDGEPHEVVGVMPADFGFPTNAQVWAPVGSLPGAMFRGAHALQVIGRLQTGSSLGLAGDDVRRAASDLEAAYPRENRDRSMRVVDLKEAILGDTRSHLRLLFAAVIAVWLLAVANTSGLLLTRTLASAREIAVRRALGASSLQVSANYLSDAVVITGSAAACGAALGLAVRPVLNWIAPAALPTAQGLPPGAAAAALAQVLGSLLVLAAVPAYAARRASLLPAVHPAAQGATQAPLGRVPARVLVAAEIASCAVLLCGALLLARSWDRISKVDLGFRTEGVVLLPVRLPPAAYAEPERARAFFDEALPQLATLPGVHAVAVAVAGPLDAGFSAPFTLPRLATEGRARLRAVSPGYFDVLDLRIRHGRAFTAADRSDAAGVVIVNESFVREFVRDEQPLGLTVQRRQFGMEEALDYEIVGVVQDELFNGPQGPVEPAIYYVFEQMPFAFGTILLRVAQVAPVALEPTIRSRISAIEPDVPVPSPVTLAAKADDAVLMPAALARIIGGFATVALILAAIGLYAVLAFDITQRRAEIAIRRALGAPGRALLIRICGEGITVAVIGLGVGLGAAWATSGLLQPLLFQLEPVNARSYLEASLILLSVAGAAALLPARRALQIHPARALRGD